MAGPETLDIETLSELAGQMPGLTRALGTTFVEATVVCLEHNGHTQGSILRVEHGSKGIKYALVWPAGTAQLRNSYFDLQAATESGAICIAVHLARLQLGMVVAQRSRKGPGFDYWLSPAGEVPELFQNTTRLEVSGILRGDDADIRRRIKIKGRQIRRSAGTPVHIVVVEFGEPVSHVVS